MAFFTRINIYVCAHSDDTHAFKRNYFSMTTRDGPLFVAPPWVGT